MKGDKFRGIPRNSPWRINEAIEKAVANPQPAKPVRAKQPRRNIERDTIHVPVMEWIYANEQTHPVLQFAFHSPNEGMRGYRGQQAVAEMGVRKGVPDLMLPLPIIFASRGIALEFKVPGNPPTPEQAEFLLYLRECNWYADVLQDAYRAIDLLNRMLTFGTIPQYLASTAYLRVIADKRVAALNDAF